ncbi:hypothetical protein [Hanstruepera ponticola]|uniref:hypothetical protein n=1 Tax=Hanstruepera ponticola TaxID=2042995 RepID=UPI000CF18F76|nr:hypothetical protein [Hanstruepera ponticola]
MSMENSIQKLLKTYESKGFEKVIDLEYLFKFRPNFVFKSKEKFIGIYTRTSALINSSVVERIAQTTEIRSLPAKNVIFFPKIPDHNVLLDCSKNRVEVCYLENGVLKFVEVEELPIAVVKHVKYIMPKLSVFLSSKQVIDERKSAERIVNVINLKYQQPIYPFAVEKNKKGKVLTPKELKLEIMNGMVDCEYFFGILTEDFSSATELEIQVALKMKKLENIRLYVKDNDQTQQAWKDLLFEIQLKYKIKGKTVWYYPFPDKFDLEEEIRKDIIEILSKKHRDNGSFFL